MIPLGPPNSNGAKKSPRLNTKANVAPASTPGIGGPFDVSLDGKRLLVNHADEEMQAPLHLVTNWLAELGK